MKLEIRRVDTERQKNAFYDFARDVYRDDPYWVPHLWPQRKAYLDRKTAFFNYGEGEFWLATRGQEVVGTIGTALDHSRIKNTGIRFAIFGFFEVLPGDYEAAEAMWDHAAAWSRARGMTELRGPYSFAPNDENGFLVEGFECCPALLMGHTPPYYAEFAERYGFQKTDDSVAYRFDMSQIGFDIANAPPVAFRIASRVIQRHGPNVIRPPRMADWDEETARLLAVYNKSLSALPGFSPLELAEFRDKALSMKPMLDPELVFIAEVGGKVVGFGLGLPNLPEALMHAHGLRRPWDYLRLAWAKRRITGVSFKILVIDPEYWGYGLETVMILEMGKAILRKGYTWVDASLTGETNPHTHKLAKRAGAKVYRRYREYRLPVS